MSGISSTTEVAGFNIFDIGSKVGLLYCALATISNMGVLGSILTYTFTHKGASVGEAILIVGLVFAMALYGKEKEVEEETPHATGDLLFSLTVTHRGSQVILDVPKTVLAQWTTLPKEDDDEDLQHYMTLDPRLELSDLENYIQYCEKGIEPLEDGPLIELANYLGDSATVEKLYLKHFSQCDKEVNEHFPQEMQLNLKINYQFRKILREDKEGEVRITTALETVLKQLDLQTPLQHPIDLNFSPIIRPSSPNVRRPLGSPPPDMVTLIPKVNRLIISTLTPYPTLPESWVEELQSIEYIDCLPNQTIMPKLKHFELQLSRDTTSRLGPSSRRLDNRVNFAFLESSPELTSFSYITDRGELQPLPKNESLKSIKISAETRQGSLLFPLYPLLEELIVRGTVDSLIIWKVFFHAIPEKTTKSTDGYTSYKLKPSVR